MAIGDMKILTDARKLTVTLDAVRAPADTLADEARRMAGAGVSHIVLDLPATTVDALAGALADTPVTLLNATAPEMSLRTRCHANLLHTSASDRMIADALVQHMVRQRWAEVLVLQGKTEADRVRAQTFIQAAERLRLEITDTRSFDLSNNPAQREENNIMLLTGGVDYDAVFIADDYGEYARYVPYRTALPRPVVGAVGLVALEWHWALERYGAPQVNSRFETATGRRMGWQDWSAWVATRAVLTAFAKTRKPGLDEVNAFLRSDRLRLDGSKGTPMSFRPWNGQLRMPILLATQNAVIDIAPIEGFLHHLNALDSLGQDESEFRCE